MCLCRAEGVYHGNGKLHKYREAAFGERAEEKGFQVFPSCANFIMFYSDEALYEKLLEKGILIRDCRNFRGLGKGFYRIAVKTRKENEILLEAIGDIRG